MPYAQQLSSIGWNATQSPTAQREAIQSALSAGPCALELPYGETVNIDQGLVAPFPVHLFGHGCDATNSAVALSQVRCATPNVNMIQLLAHNSIIEDINFHSDAANSHGYGVLVGDGGTHKPVGVNLSRVSTGSSNWRGVGIISGQELTVRDCFVFSQDAAYTSDNEIPDSGDNHIIGGEFNAYGGWCVRMLSGGGLNIGGSAKLLNGIGHINMAWNKGGSGGLQVDHASLENASGTVSCLLDGSMPFERIAFSNVSWGNGATCMRVQSSAQVAWLKQLDICNNVMKVMGPASLSAVDLDYCQQICVADNSIDGTGAAYTGIIVRGNCYGYIGPNIIRNLTGAYPAILNTSGNGGKNVFVSPNQP